MKLSCSIKLWIYFWVESGFRIMGVTENKHAEQTWRTIFFICTPNKWFPSDVYTPQRPPPFFWALSEFQNCFFVRYNEKCGDCSCQNCRVRIIGSCIVDWVTGVAFGVMSRRFAQMTAQYVQRKKTSRLHWATHPARTCSYHRGSSVATWSVVATSVFDRRHMQLVFRHAFEWV